ncbi:phospholipid:diacylglycerol acyltransferase [Gurleya vavrai]
MDGLDPEGIKVRAMNGFSSSDYIFPMYWVWQKMLNNFGILGYDHLNLHVSTFDWRLSIENLEKRDKYFTRLKMDIEMYYNLNNKTQVVLLTHSLGGIVTLNFLKWVNLKDPFFVDKYLKSIINIASPFLGATKSISGLLSGESKSTTSFFEGIVFDFLLQADGRKKVFSTWGSIKALLPQGGKYIWGDNFIVDIDGDKYDIEEIVKVVRNKCNFEGSLKMNYKEIKNNIEKVIEKTQNIEAQNIFDNQIIKDQLKQNFLIEYINLITMQMHDMWINFRKEKFSFFFTEEYFMRFKRENNIFFKIFNLIQNKFFFSKLTTEICPQAECLTENIVDEKVEEKTEEIKQLNPLEFKLPDAENIKIFCLYGVGLNTECGYYYTNKNGNLRINRKINNDNTKNGIKICDGDGTVPSFSCGYMAYKGWKDRKLNPSGIKTIAKEYGHDRNLLSVRGGSKSSDHVDILGNANLTEDVLKICCGEDELIENRILGNLDEFCDGIEDRKKEI